MTITAINPKHNMFSALTWQTGGIAAGEMYVITAGSKNPAQITKYAIQFSGPIKDETCVKINAPAWGMSIYARFEEWMEGTFGPGGRNRRCNWRKNHVRVGVYYVRGELNATLVRLKWANANLDNE